MCKVELNVHHASLKRNKNKNLFSENQKMGFSLLTVDGQYDQSRVCSLSSCGCEEAEKSVRREHFDLWAQHRQSHAPRRHIIPVAAAASLPHSLISMAALWVICET